MNFNRGPDLEKTNMVFGKDIFRTRTNLKGSTFSIKSILIKITLGAIGILILIFLEPVMDIFNPNGSNNTIMSWGSLFAAILVIIGLLGINELVKKLLKL